MSSTPRMLRRLLNVPLARRVPQVVNALATPVLCRPFKLAHLVEHPKCGGSWVRNMICDYRGTSRYMGNRLIRPGDVIQVHRLYRRSYRMPIVVVRDPRDLFVSFYYHETRYERREQRLEIHRYFEHDPEAPVEEDFARYLRAKLVHRTHPPFSYTEFIQSWLYRPRVCMVRYEDLLDDCDAEMLRIVRFLRLDLDLERLAAVVEDNDFETETRKRYGEGRKAGEADPTKFQRKGISGDWKNHFNAESCELIQRFEGWTLKVLGYESSRSWIDDYLASKET